MARKRSPNFYFFRYCAPKQDELGYWSYDGTSPLAETELVERLGLIMIKRNRSDVWESTPPKTRQVLRFDVGATEDDSLLAKRITNERSLYKALEAELKHTKEHVVENVVENLLCGEKDIVWVLTRESVEIMTKALDKACSSKDVATAMRKAKVRIWATHGEADVKTRIDLARQYREHDGAGVLIATMDSLPEAISLFGATTEHYAQLHYLSGPMEQSENRPYLKDTSRLHIIYYIPKGGVAERMEKIVIPRLIAADKVGSSQDAAAVSKLFEKKTESWDDMLKRLTASGPDDGEVDIGDAMQDIGDELPDD